MGHLAAGLIRAFQDREMREGSEGLEAHLATCPQCAQEAREQDEALTTLSGALSLLDTPPPMERARARILRLEQEKRKPWQQVRRNLPRAASFAVLGLCAALVAAWVEPRSDLSFAFPREATADTQLLVDQLQRGPAAGLVLLAVGLRRRGFLVLDARIKARLPRTALASVAMGAALWGLFQWLEPGFDGGVFSRVLALVLLVGSGLAVYAALALILGAARLEDLRTIARRRS